ncbi:MAG: sugar phosphate isomerase/epimerase [Anaerolineae bacterium]|nr:sugar phosphate isomerase/epimerase [Anaerolineae bacterium]
MLVRYGAHCYLFTDRWADDQIHLLDAAKALGLDVWEIAVGDDVFFAPHLTKRRAETLGLTLTISPGGAWPVDCDLSADDPADRARGLAWHKRQIDLGAELGAIAYTGALYGHPGTVKRRRPPAGELEWTVHGLHELAAYGAQCGIETVIEPMSHFRTHLINTAAQAAQLIQRANHPNLRVLLDTYHLVTEIRDYTAAIHQVGDHLWGIHACESDRGVPGGGLVPWASIFTALRDIDFDGHVLFETYNSAIGPSRGDFAFQRGMFHDPCPDGEVFVRKALAFVQAGLAQARNS